MQEEAGDLEVKRGLSGEGGLRGRRGGWEEVGKISSRSDCVCKWL